MTDSLETTALDRVAKAIYEQEKPALLYEETWHELVDERPGDADAYRNSARAAIRALRNPTDQMVRAACKLTERETPYDFDMTLAAWRTMIDEALK